MAAQRSGLWVIPPRTFSYSFIRHFNIAVAYWQLRFCRQSCWALMLQRTGVPFGLMLDMQPYGAAAKC